MDYGQQAADRSQRIIERRLKGVYQDAYKELKRSLSEHTRKYRQKDAQMRRKLIAGQITPHEYATWQKGQVFIGKKWQAKVNHAADMLTHANREAMNIINGEKLSVFAENWNYQAYELEKEANLAFGFGIYDSDTVARLIREEPELLPRRTVNGQKDKAWNVKQISNAVTQGIISGDDIPTIANRIAMQTASSDMKAMVRYARTAMTGAQNAGRIDMLHNAQSMGIRVQKKWLATLDNRTRDSHQRLDGQVREVDKPFHSMFGDIRYPGDPLAAPGDVYNCRCTLTYVYPDFADIHEQYSDNDMRRDNETGEEIRNMDYLTWKKWRKIIAPSGSDEDIIKISTGAGKSVPFDVSDAVLGANPRYPTGEYKANCQRCVVAYELRRRGYSVTALGISKKDEKIYWGTECFEDNSGKSGKSLYKFGKLASEIHNEVANASDGNRYIVYGINQNGLAHVFIAEKAGGMVYYVDPQSGSLDCSRYFNEMIDGEYGICQINDKVIKKRRSLLRYAVRRTKR